ncbi:MAG: hypothetical protein R3248_09070, partial [Candidatus Promineifilaceae bacterium]|nr:hypothetical protein [Candidatus Promineifilaceae bacterium]
MTAVDEKLREMVAYAYEKVPAVRERFGAAGLTAEDVQSVADLEKVPVLPKDDVIAHQQADPP